MTRPALCPDASQLKELLDSSNPDEEQSELIQHLDSCTCCQQTLEALATDGAPWSLAVRHVDQDQPPASSAFWPALEQLESDVTRIETPTDLLTSAEITLDFLSPAEEPGALGRLGHFDVVEVIGRGGMGVVLKGFDACLQRYVALKVLDPKLADNDMARKRFCREARAAASVTHENVVAVHQVEREEGSGLPYLVMQFVAGESLQERLDRGGRLELRDILSIGVQTASGLAAAHAQGLIHRDIKPANILLENGKRVRLTDFGLARAFDDVKLTQTGFVAGTPLYMAPEQARGEELDPRTDLFSLGSVLYAMCTGQAPFEGSTPYLVLKRVAEEQPRPIREINPEIPPWLAEVIDKLLAKKPADRYSSAAEVAELLGHHLVEVQHSTQVRLPGPSSTPSGPRVSRLASLRPRGTWALLLAASLLLLMGFAVTELSGLTRITGLRAPDPGRQGTEPGAEKLDVRQARATFFGNAGPAWSVAFSPDGKTVAMGLDDGTVKLWDVAEEKVRATLHGQAGPIWTVAFSPDGKTLAAGSTNEVVKLWDMPAGIEHCSLKHTGSVRALAFSRDGKLLATGSRDGSVRIWDLETRQEPVTTAGHTREVMSVAFSPDGRTLASGSGDKTIKLWDVATGSEQLTIQGHLGGVYAVAFSPDGKTLASGGWDKKVHLWDAATGNRKMPRLSGHASDIWSVAFSPDGKTLVTGSDDHTVKWWDLASGRELATFQGHTGSVYSVAFSPDGKTVASAGRDGTVKLWDAR